MSDEGTKDGVAAQKSVFVTREIPAVGLATLRERGYRVDVFPKDRAPSPRELARRLRRHPYDAVVFLLTDRIDARAFDAAPAAKLFAAFSVGFDNVDLAEARRRGITVTNTGAASAVPVAEHAIALMLGLTTRMVEADRFTRKGKYRGWAPMAFVGTDLSGKTIGLVGTGGIGAAVARVARHGFDARIVYYDPVRNESLERECGATRHESLDALLAESDIVSLHVPLLDSTRHLIDGRALGLMKPTAFLVNTARGPVVDEDALVRALKAGQIAGAGLDVYEREPALARGLAKLPNVVLTPHIASARKSARDAMAASVAESVIDFFEGRTPKNVVRT